MIRPMSKDDFPVIEQLEKELFTSPWPIKEYAYELDENPYAHVYVLEEEGKIVGYYDYWILYEQAQIATIGVATGKRRQGYAQQMMNRIIEDCNQAGCEFLSLEVRVSNQAAISLYKKNGFVIVNTRKNYYEDNHEDAYLMVRALEGVPYGNITSD